MSVSVLIPSIRAIEGVTAGSHIPTLNPCCHLVVNTNINRLLKCLSLHNMRWNFRPFTYKRVHIQDP